MKTLKFIALSDLHGNLTKYIKLFNFLSYEHIDAVFLCGDLLPNFYKSNLSQEDFFKFFRNELLKLEKQLNLPQFFVILGNDDSKLYEKAFAELYDEKYWKYINQKLVKFECFEIFGYSYVPPTPFKLKDWEKYDVSRYVDPGAISPLEGFYSVEVDFGKLEWETIEKDLKNISNSINNFDCLIAVFHTPPYKTFLDRAALDGVTYDHVPVDVHVGSIAVKRFIEEKQPKITLHGHVHESTRLTGHWMQKINRTTSFNVANDDNNIIAIVMFDPEKPECARRILI